MCILFTLKKYDTAHQILLLIFLSMHLMHEYMLTKKPLDTGDYNL